MAHATMIRRCSKEYLLSQPSNLGRGAIRPTVPFVPGTKRGDNDGQRQERFNFYDVSWKGPFNSSDIAKQASAVSLLVALI